MVKQVPGARRHNTSSDGNRTFFEGFGVAPRTTGTTPGCVNDDDDDSNDDDYNDK